MKRNRAADLEAFAVVSTSGRFMTGTPPEARYGARYKGKWFCAPSTDELKEKIYRAITEE